MIVTQLTLSSFLSVVRILHNRAPPPVSFFLCSCILLYFACACLCHFFVIMPGMPAPSFVILPLLYIPFTILSKVCRVAFLVHCLLVWFCHLVIGCSCFCVGVYNKLLGFSGFRDFLGFSIRSVHDCYTTINFMDVL